MKAAVCEAFGKPLSLQDMPDPAPGPGEVLIRMKGCGVCHSDLHLIDGDWVDWGTPLPIIPGHEVTGVVERAGDQVTSLKAGTGWGSRGCSTPADNAPHAGPARRCCARPRRARG